MLSISSALLVVLVASTLVSCQGTDEGTVNAEEPSTRPPLTGNPQIDYIWDPNLPRELNGFNMSTYPFLRSVPPPDKMDFKCDGRHDGFYASVPHKCQVYHHCLFGIRYDFLCANFTAFDQKNFICHFANEVDCDNSPLFYDRNEALYKTTSTTTPEPPPIRSRNPGRRPRPGLRRRPARPFRPVYYDDFDDDYFQDYDEVPQYEDEGEAQAKPNDAETEDEVARPARPSGKRPAAKNQANKSGDLFSNGNRPPPRIRPPVPNGEGSKKSAKTAKTTTTTAPVEEEFEDEEADEEVPITTTTTQAPKRPKAVGGRKSKPTTTTTTTTASPEEEEEYDEIEEESEPSTTTTTARPKKLKTTTTARKVVKTAATTTTTTTTTAAPDVDEEVELPTKPNASLFSRRGPSILAQRRNGKQTSTTPAAEEEEEEELEEPITTTTTTQAPARRTSRPLRSRASSQQVATPAPQVEQATEEPVKTPAPTSRPATASRSRTPSNVETEEVQQAPINLRDPATRARLRNIRLTSARKVPEVPVDVAEEDVELEEGASQLSVDQASRQGRNVPTWDEAASDETLDWSIINLFSRALPQRS